MKHSLPLTDMQSTIKQQDDGAPMDIELDSPASTNAPTQLVSSRVTTNSTTLSSSTDLTDASERLTSGSLASTRIVHQHHSDTTGNSATANNEALASCDESKFSCSPDYGITADHSTQLSSGSDEGFSQAGHSHGQVSNLRQQAGSAVQSDSRASALQKPAVKSFGDLFDDDDLD